MIKDRKFDYHRHIPGVQAADAAYVDRKDRQYDASWKRRGGVGAFFTIVRPWDRLESMLAVMQSTTKNGVQAYDILDAIGSEGLEGPDGSVVACVRDLRRYLLLVECEAMERHLAPLPDRQRAKSDRLLFECGTDRCEKICEQCAQALSMKNGSYALVDNGTQHFFCDDFCAELWKNRGRIRVADEDHPQQHQERFRPSASAREQESPRTPADGGQHSSLAPWAVSTRWRFKHDMQVGAAREKIFDRFYVLRGRDIFVLNPSVFTTDAVPRELEDLYRRTPYSVDTYTLCIEDCPTDARDFFPDLQLEANHKELTEKEEWSRSLYEWFEAEGKYRLTKENLGWHVQR